MITMKYNMILLSMVLATQWGCSDKTSTSSPRQEIGVNRHAPDRAVALLAEDLFDCITLMRDRRFDVFKVSAQIATFANVESSLVDRAFQVLVTGKMTKERKDEMQDELVLLWFYIKTYNSLPSESNLVLQWLPSYEGETITHEVKWPWATKDNKRILQIRRWELQGAPPDFISNATT